MKKSLSFKLIGSFLAITVLGMVVGAVGIFSVKKLDDSSDLIDQRIVSVIPNMVSINSDFLWIRLSLRDLMAAKTPEEKQKSRDRIESFQKGLVENFAAYQKSLFTDEGRKIAADFEASFAAYKAVLDDVMKLVAAEKLDEGQALVKSKGTPAALALQTSIDKLIEVKVKYSQASSKEASETGHEAIIFMWVLTISSVLLSVALSIIMPRHISRKLNKVSEQLSDGAQQVSSASEELSSTSQATAEGASESAASLEETASAMEELSAMTRQNAENAGLAKTLSDKMRGNVEKANGSMKSMTSAMEQISSRSEEIGKIIKTIDEIAFQTNLLALNAAVEAARAGEAGAGFAVVADEVRNLAQRAAAAARNTSEMIEGTIQVVTAGATLVEETNEDFREVALAVSKVTELIGEISAASSEQSRGITEVGSAITQMDKVTQQNAANSEEIAASSEELNAQALSMQGTVTELDEFIRGGGSGTKLVSIDEGRKGLNRRLQPARDF